MLNKKDFLVTSGAMRPAGGRKHNPETDIQNSVRDLLRADGWFVIRHQQGMGAHKGLSDLTALKDGETIYVEIKTPKGRLSEWQEIFKHDIEAHGGRYIVCRSIEDIYPVLTSISRLF